MKLKTILTILFLLLLSGGGGTVYAQEKFEWNVDFKTIFDNREGDSRMTATRTFLQTQLAPSAGVSFGAGTHTLMAGVVWTQPVGTEWREGKLAPTLYYAYRRHGLRGALGMFPRSMLVRPVPNYVWSDSSYYTQANVRGGAISYESGRGYIEGIMDWRGIQSDSRREAFNIILRGEYGGRDRFLSGGLLLMMNHLALTRNSGPDEHIVDNFLYNPYLAVDFSRRLPLDSLSLRAGVLGVVTRHRAEPDWRSPIGAWVEIDLRWRWLWAKNTFYGGSPLFPYYSDFGALLDQGEPYFRSSWYERLSVAASLVRNERVDLRVGLDFNFARNNFTFYQRILLAVTFGSRQQKASRLIPF